MSTRAWRALFPRVHALVRLCIRVEQLDKTELPLLNQAEVGVTGLKWHCKSKWMQEDSENCHFYVVFTQVSAQQNQVVRE